MRTLTTLEKAFISFKVFTANFSVFYAVCLAVFAGWVMVNLNILLGTMIALHAAFVFLCGRSIVVSLLLEDRQRRFSDYESS
jgi:hypothetical protein